MHNSTSPSTNYLGTQRVLLLTSVLYDHIVKGGKTHLPKHSKNQVNMSEGIFHKSINLSSFVQNYQLP